MHLEFRFRAIRGRRTLELLRVQTLHGQPQKVSFLGAWAGLGRSAAPSGPAGCSGGGFLRGGEEQHFYRRESTYRLTAPSRRLQSGRTHSSTFHPSLRSCAVETNFYLSGEWFRSTAMSRNHSKSGLPHQIPVHPWKPRKQHRTVGKSHTPSGSNT